MVGYIEIANKVVKVKFYTTTSQVIHFVNENGGSVSFVRHDANEQNFTYIAKTILEDAETAKDGFEAFAERTGEGLLEFVKRHGWYAKLRNIGLL